MAFYDLITWIARHGAVACAARFVAKDSVVGALQCGKMPTGANCDGKMTVCRWWRCETLVI